MKLHFAILAIAAVFVSTAAIAQAPAAAPRTAGVKATVKPAASPSSLRRRMWLPSRLGALNRLDCSKEADAKKLHGKPRKTFMSTCKKS